MLNPEAFKLPLEAQLKLRVINDEIEACEDPKQLQANLKATTEMLMNYQHIINEVIKEQLHRNMLEFGEVAQDLLD